MVEKVYTSKTLMKMTGGRMHIPQPTPWICPLPKTVETIKRVKQKTGMFLSLGTINFVLFY